MKIKKINSRRHFSRGFSIMEEKPKSVANLAKGGLRICAQKRVVAEFDRLGKLVF